MAYGVESGWALCVCSAVIRFVKVVLIRFAKKLSHHGLYA